MAKNTLKVLFLNYVHLINLKLIIIEKSSDIRYDPTIYLRVF